MFYTNSVSEFLLVTIHAPSGDGNILQQFNVNYYFKLQSTPRQGTEMRVCCRVGLRARRVTIHAPSGDGNWKGRCKSCLSVGYNPRPVRGRKFLFFVTPDVIIKLQSTPRQGTEIRTRFVYLAPPRLQSTPRQGTEICSAGQCPSGVLVTIHAPSGDGNSEQNFLFRVC